MGASSYSALMNALELNHYAYAGTEKDNGL
jgi:hypothetical protein